MSEKRRDVVGPIVPVGQVERPTQSGPQNSGGEDSKEDPDGQIPGDDDQAAGLGLK